jgi:hypothetical protein
MTKHTPPASPSDAPASLTIDDKSLRLRVRLKYLRWAVASLLSVAGIGGAGWVGVKVVAVKPASAAEVQALDSSNAKDHRAIRDELRSEAVKTAADRTELSAVTATVRRMEDKQIRGQAREEAHRLADEIRDRRRSAFEYDRLFELNLRRLAAGKDPCGSLACQGE